LSYNSKDASGNPEGRQSSTHSRPGQSFL